MCLKPSKQKVAQCTNERKMFCLPAEAMPYVVEHYEIEPTGSILTGDFWKLKKEDDWLEIEYSSKDKCRTFQINPDRSCISIKGNIKQDISYSDSWDEK